MPTVNEGVPWVRPALQYAWEAVEFARAGRAEQKQGFGSLCRLCCWLGVDKKTLQAISEACKDIRAAVLVTFLHCSWGGNLVKENKNRG